MYNICEFREYDSDIFLEVSNECWYNSRDEYLNYIRNVNILEEYDLDVNFDQPTDPRQMLQEMAQERDFEANK